MCLDLEQIEDRLHQQFCSDKFLCWSVDRHGPSRSGNYRFFISGVSAPQETYEGDYTYDVYEQVVMYRRRDDSFVVLWSRYYGSLYL